MPNQRHNNILRILAENNRTTVVELSDHLKVSSVTIRQDLTHLESEGLLKRVHGGAVLKDADDLANRLGFNYEKKLRIARRVSRLVRDGETILIESGSANALLARELLKKRNITLVTTNVYIARQSRKIHQSRVILAGGCYQQESETLVGKITRDFLDQINYDKAFVGIDGYTAATGFTHRDLHRAEIASHIIKRACDTFIISDSTKFGRTALTNICYPADVQHIAADKDLGPEFRSEFEKSGIDLILA